MFKDRYRIESTRLKGWDYSQAGAYFVTLCTRQRECFFGEVIDREMHLSPIGEIVTAEWQRTPQVRTNVELDEWVVMPNHLHGIIVITHRVATTDGVETFRGVKTFRGVETFRAVETFRRNVSTTNARLKPNSLGSIIGQFKSICTKRIRAAGYAEFDWQERFFDEIIRDEKRLERVRQYIINNPANWNKDKENAIGSEM
jgi:REP element-mobilizing transposase RayT